MGKPELPDRLAQMLVALVALFSLGNGAFMLGDPTSISFATSGLPI